MTNRSEYDSNTNVHPETIPTVENTSTREKRVGVVEEVPVRRETVTTTHSTSHSHHTKSKKEFNPSIPILGAIALAIPLAGILGYLLHQPKERVVTRTVTNTVPVLTVPASPAPAASPSPVGPAIVGPESVGPARVGPARVGPDRVGNE